MSLSIDDDWLKPTESQSEDQRDVGHSSSVSGGLADLHLPADLQLPDLGRWWVDLEFLDLASGPPANYSSASQDRNKNKNPTLGYNFPDIFFDTTSSTSLFGSSVDDSHRFDRYESFKDHGLDFEKGLLADLFPTSSVVQPAEKLLDDLDLVSTAAPSTSDVPSREGVPSTSSGSSGSATRPLGVKPPDSKDDDDDMYGMSTDVLQSISKNFSELEQEFEKVAATVDGATGKMGEFKLSVDVGSGGKTLKQFFQLDETKGGKSKDEDDDIYSVPPEVLHSISKNFSELQQEFDKVATTVVNESGDMPKPSGDPNDQHRLKRYLRIKSVKSFSGHHSITAPPPKGTVARIFIQTDKKQNATIFSITPNDSDDPEQSFTVHTSNLSEATSLIKPLHLDKLPIFKRILSNLIPSVKLKRQQEQQKDQESSKEAEEEKLVLAQLAQQGVHLAKLDSVSTPESGLVWLCPDCNMGIGSLNLLKDHILDHRNLLPSFRDNLFSEQEIMMDISIQSSDRIETPKKPENGFQISDQSCSGATTDSASLWLCPECQNCFPDTALLKQHMMLIHPVFPSADNSEATTNNQEIVEQNTEFHVPAAYETEKKDFLNEMSQYGIVLSSIECVFTSNSNSKRNWLCPDCQKGFAKKSLLKEHLFQHRNVKPFRCEEPGCTWAFFNAFKLKRHQMTVHTQTVSFTCNMPGCETKKFSSVYNLNAHLKKHDRPQAFDCKFCPDRFQTRKGLEGHLRLHPEYQGEFQCSECNKKFISSEDLSKHLRVHSLVKNELHCLEPGCGKSFKKPSLLKAHSLIHSGRKPYPCVFEGCNTAFRTTSKLRRHERIHKNDRKNVCKICSKSYLRPDHLRGHMLSAHSHIRFSCVLDSCGAKFSAKSTLYSHMKKHKEGQTASKHFYRCVIEACGEKFENRKLLSHHVSMRHETELGSAGGDQMSSQQLTSSQEATDESELDFIALLSSVGDDEMSAEQTNVIETSVEGQVTDMTDVMSLVLPNHPDVGITITATTMDTSSPSHLAAVNGYDHLEDDAEMKISPRPKDLITVDTSAITPVKNPDFVVQKFFAAETTTMAQKRGKRKSGSANPPQASLLKSTPGSARTDPLKNGALLKRIADKKLNVVIVPEGFVGEDL